MNTVYLKGNVGNDPKKSMAKNGNEGIFFTLATTERIHDKEFTTWHNIVGWGYLTKKPIQKGQTVFITGKIVNRSYEDKEGVVKYVSEVVADSIEIIQRLTAV
jgi:single-strand DNA-binding protein